MPQAFVIDPSLTGYVGQLQSEVAFQFLPHQVADDVFQIHAEIPCRIRVFCPLKFFFQKMNFPVDAPQRLVYHFNRQPQQRHTKPETKIAMSTIATLSGADLKSARKKLADLKKKQDALREQELEIRTYLADVLFPEEEGSKMITIDGVKVAIKRNLNRSITREDAERLTKEHPNESLAILSWRPEVKTSGYREFQSIADDYITTRPGPPSVEFKD